MINANDFSVRSMHLIRLCDQCQCWIAWKTSMIYHLIVWSLIRIKKRDQCNWLNCVIEVRDHTIDWIVNQRQELHYMINAIDWIVKSTQELCDQHQRMNAWSRRQGLKCLINAKNRNLWSTPKIEMYGIVLYDHRL